MPHDTRSKVDPGYPLPVTIERRPGFPHSHWPGLHPHPDGRTQLDSADVASAAPGHTQLDSSMKWLAPQGRICPVLPPSRRAVRSRG
jgi:hypothetical protein